MADDRGSSAAAIVLVFLSGAALGAVAALLLAPQTGRESREQLRGYARRAEDNLWDLADRAGETFEEVVGGRRCHGQTVGCGGREGICGLEEVSPARGV